MLIPDDRCMVDDHHHMSPPGWEGELPPSAGSAEGEDLYNTIGVADEPDGTTWAGQDGQLLAIWPESTGMEASPDNFHSSDNVPEITASKVQANNETVRF